LEVVVDTERFIELETKLAYQEDTIQQLNNVVCRQQDQIDALMQKCEMLTSRTEALSNKFLDDSGESEVPPHY
jgi:SlyX protein